MLIEDLILKAKFVLVNSYGLKKRFVTYQGIHIAVMEVSCAEKMSMSKDIYGRMQRKQRKFKPFSNSFPSFLYSSMRSDIIKVATLRCFDFSGKAL